MRRSVLLASGAAAAAAALVLAPAAAMAAPVPYVYVWTAGELLEYTDPIAGVGEVVPTTNPAFAVTGLDVDGSGAGFAVSFNESHLFSVNVLSGVVEDLGALMFADVPIEGCTGLDYTGGVLRLACDSVAGYPAESTYLQVDPATLTATVVANGPVRVASIAVNPLDGVLYGFGYGNEIVAVEGGVGTVIGDAGALVWGADFATDGSLWGIVNDTSTAPATIGGWAFTAAALDVAGGGFVENITVFEAAAPVVPAGPSLPATGSDTAPVLLGAVALIAVGAGIAAASTVRRRTV